MPSFRAPFIPLAQIRAEADAFREKYWAEKSVPVDVMGIVEFDLQMEIRPVAGMREELDVDAVLLGDMQTLVVDLGHYMDDRMQNRLRYSVAHEIGHKVLHADIYRAAGVASAEEWLHWFQSIPDDQYSWLEQHAHEFAGRLLVPPERLMSELAGAVERARQTGFVSWDSSGDAAREYIASSICRVFGVSSQVIEKRIDRERFWPPG